MSSYLKIPSTLSDVKRKVKALEIIGVHQKNRHKNQMQD